MPGFIALQSCEGDPCHSPLVALKKNYTDLLLKVTTKANPGRLSCKRIQKQ